MCFRIFRAGAVRPSRFHQQAVISPKFVSLRPENNSFLYVRNRFCLDRGKSLRQYEEICETAYWQKIRKKGQFSLQVSGALRTYVHIRTDPRLSLNTPQSIPNSACACIGTVNYLSPSNSSRSGLTN